VRTLQQAIKSAFIDDGKREQMKRRCRKVVKKEFTLEKQSKDYMSIYRSIYKN